MQWNGLCDGGCNCNGLCDGGCNWNGLSVPMWLGLSLTSLRLLIPRLAVFVQQSLHFVSQSIAVQVNGIVHNVINVQKQFSTFGVQSPGTGVEAQSHCALAQDLVTENKEFVVEKKSSGILKQSVQLDPSQLGWNRFSKQHGSPEEEKKIRV